MANIDFPASPTNGQLFTPVNGVAYKWLAAPGIWVVEGGAVAVTSVSVVSANGLAGTVATPTSTPAITLNTTVNGMVKGNGTALSAATAGTDYVIPSALSAYAPLASPVFTGDPTAPTAPIADADLSVANTAWVQNEIASIPPTGAILTGFWSYNAASTAPPPASGRVRISVAWPPTAGASIHLYIHNTDFDGFAYTWALGPFINDLIVFRTANGGRLQGVVTAISTPSGTGPTGYLDATVTVQTIVGALVTNARCAISVIRGGTNGTVTSTSVVSANGLAGTVANATTTPAITLSTTISGMLKGNATAISAAVSGTDYMTPANVTTALGSYLPLAGGTLSGQLNSTTSLTGASTPALNIDQTWNNAATQFFGINANFVDTASNVNSTLLNITVGGATRFFVNKAGTGVLAGSLQLGAGNQLTFATRSNMYSPADGQLALRDAAGTAFNRLQFGGTTNLFPAIKRTTTALNVRLADDSADADLTFKTQTYPNNTTLGATTAYVTAAITAGGGGGASITVSATPPVTPADGALWFYTDAVTGGGQLMIYYNDGTSSAWVPASASAVTTPAPPYGHLYGLTLSNNSTTGINFAPGQCADSTNAVMITNTTSINKLISATWAAGTGAGGLGNGVTRVASTWYHMFGGTLTTGGAFDAWYDTSVTGANKPAAFSANFRRLGSILTGTGGTPPIIAFTQSGDWFGWAALAQDINLTTPGLTAVNRVLRTPLGVVTEATFLWAFTNSNVTTAAQLYLYEPGVDPTVATATPVAQAASAATWSFLAGGSLTLRTNTSSQIGTRVQGLGTADVGFSATTIGWTDTRGRTG